MSGWHRVGYPTDSARDLQLYVPLLTHSAGFADVQSGAVAAPASVTIGSVSESYTATAGSH